MLLALIAYLLLRRQICFVCFCENEKAIKIHFELNQKEDLYSTIKFHFKIPVFAVFYVDCNLQSNTTTNIHTQEDSVITVTFI